MTFVLFGSFSTRLLFGYNVCIVAEIKLFNASMTLNDFAIGAGEAGTLNMWYESDLDALISRT